MGDIIGGSMNKVVVTRDDLMATIEDHGGNDYFQEALAKIGLIKRNLLKVIGRYVYFNSVFGGGVANLAGEIAELQQVFRDPNESVTSLADRSDTVAAAIFYAAVDEFGDQNTSSRFTHRALAQATVKGIAHCLGYQDKDIDPVVAIDDYCRKAVAMVKEGYVLDQHCDLTKLFRGIGFHMGSEILADMEFRILDSFLRTKWVELVADAKKMRVRVNDADLPAYSWIAIHTSVEADHFDFSLKSANAALGYYAGPMSTDAVRHEILLGFKKFSNVQTYFMKRALLDSLA